MQKEFCVSPFLISLKSRRMRADCALMLFGSVFMKKQQKPQSKGALSWCGGKKKKKVGIFKLHFPSRLTAPFTKLTWKWVLNFQSPLREMGGKLLLTGVGIFDKACWATSTCKGSSRCAQLLGTHSNTWQHLIPHSARERAFSYVAPRTIQTRAPCRSLKSSAHLA